VDSKLRLLQSRQTVQLVEVEHQHSIQTVVLLPSEFAPLQSELIPIFLETVPVDAAVVDLCLVYLEELRNLTIYPACRVLST